MVKKSIKKKAAKKKTNKKKVAMKKTAKTDAVEHKISKVQRVHKRVVKQSSFIMKIVAFFLIIVFAAYFFVDLYLGRYFEMILLALMIIVLYPALKKPKGIWKKLKFPIVIRLMIVIFLLSFYVAVTIDKTSVNQKIPENINEGILGKDLETVIHAKEALDAAKDSKSFEEEKSSPKVKVTFE